MKKIGYILCIVMMCLAVLCGCQKQKHITITQYGNWEGLQQMSYAVVGTDGSLTLIDGGDTDQVACLLAVIKEHHNHVTNWILTHSHQDHMNAFNAIMRSEAAITVDHIYTIDMDGEVLEAHHVENDQIQTWYDFNALIDQGMAVSYLYAGDTVELQGGTLKVLRAYADDCVEKQRNVPNNSSLVFTITGETERMLFLSDITAPEIMDELYAAYPDDMKAAYVQTAHHGNAYPYELYEAIGADTYFLDAPNWLVTDGERFKAAALLEGIKAHGQTAFTFETAPNTIELK